MYGESRVQTVVCSIKNVFRLMLLLLFYQSYLVQYSLLFNFADWQCVVLIISMCGLVATKQLDGSCKTRQVLQNVTVLADRTRRFLQDSTGFAVSSPFCPLRRLITLLTAVII